MISRAPVAALPLVAAPFVVAASLLTSGCSSVPRGPEPGDAPPVETRFPERVVLRTGRLAFNAFFQFALDEKGRIWVRPARECAETKGFPDEWRLFGSGLPENDAKADFVKPKRILAIDADADELMAISEKHRHYSIRWQKNPVFAGTPRQWTDIEGWPVEGPHVWDERVLENRGWGIGRRNQLCQYFDDIEGKPHWGGGGLTTYYFLSKDGTEVYFSDSGLPPDYSHTIPLPERSTVVAEGFSVGASTLFVIDRTGQTWTRLYDFDTSGSDIMFFEYTYDRRNKKQSAIAIPAEDWLPHAKIPLAGKARLSSQLSVVQTGDHNRSRELRVGGLDAEGRPGYWAKPVFFQKDGDPHRDEVRTWEFHSVPDLALDPARLLDADECRRSEPGPRVPSRDVALEGTADVDGVRAPVQVALVDWNVECSPATLRVSSGEDHVDVVLHTVEEWFHLKRRDPGRDGTPKKYLGTLEVPAAALATRNPALKAFVEKALVPYDVSDFALWVEGTNDYVAVETRSRPRFSPALSLGLLRPGGAARTVAAARTASLRRDAFTRAATSPGLQVAAVASCTDAAALEKAIDRNERAREELEKAFRENTDLDAQTPFYVTRSGIRAVQVLGTVLGGVSLWAPYVRNLLGELPALISKNAELKETIFLASREDHDEAAAILDARIAAYKRRQGELEKGPSPWQFPETRRAAWACVAHGSREASAPGAERVRVDDADLAADEPEGADPKRGLRVTFDGPQLRLRVDPLRLAKAVFEASLAGTVASAKNPLVLDAKVTLESVDEAGRALVARAFRSDAERASEVARGRLTIQQGRYELRVGDLTVTWSR